MNHLVHRANKKRLDSVVIIEDLNKKAATHPKYQRIINT